MSVTARRGPMVAGRSAEGYIVRTFDLGEADRIAVLVSAEDGRIEGVARGARRMKSRYGSALEPLSRVRVSYRERPGRDLVTFERVELLSSSFDLLSSPEGLAAFSHMADLARAVVMPGEGHPRLVRLVGALLDAARPDRVGEAAASEARLERLRVYFDVWVCRLEGFWPDLNACAGCGDALPGALRIGVHTQGGLCASCARSTPGLALMVSAEAALLARAMLSRSPREIADGETTPRAVEELGRAASALLSVHLERAPASHKMPATVVRRATGPDGP